MTPQKRHGVSNHRQLGCGFFSKVLCGEYTDVRWIFLIQGPVMLKMYPCDMTPSRIPTEGLNYSDVIMSAMAFQITSVMVVNWTFYSGADQRKDQSSASLAFARVIHRWPVNSPHKRPVTRKMFPFDDVIMAVIAFQAPSETTFLFTVISSVNHHRIQRVEKITTI